MCLCSCWDQSRFDQHLAPSNSTTASRYVHILIPIDHIAVGVPTSEPLQQEHGAAPNLSHMSTARPDVRRRQDRCPHPTHAIIATARGAPHVVATMDSRDTEQRYVRSGKRPLRDPRGPYPDRSGLSGRSPPPPSLLLPLPHPTPVSLQTVDTPTGSRVGRRTAACLWGGPCVAPFQRRPTRRRWRDGGVAAWQLPA